MATHPGPAVDLPLRGPAPTRRRWWWDALQHAAEDLASQVRRPATVRRLTELAPNERVLTYACDTDEASVVATDAALHPLTGPDGAESWSRWGWEQVAQVAWDAQHGTLTVVGLVPWLPRRTVLRFADRVPLVDLATERVAWTRQLATRLTLGDGTVDVVVRRQPVSDRMYWLVHPGEAVDVDDPRVRAELDDALTRLRADTGL
ncbi:MAG: hypothetical protein GEU96_22580 [Propionibacteriales bacterium]|nr:hypothetical protein [Propionibacteriales bacterium]